MTKCFLIVIAVLFVVSMVFFFLWRLSVAKRKSQKDTIVRLSGQLKNLRESNCRLEQTIDVLKKNREKADERIDGLHDGDSVSNALDELCKRKN